MLRKGYGKLPTTPDDAASGASAPPETRKEKKRMDATGLMRYQRNANNLDFFAHLALLILRGQWG
jgi:hypothetical protein